MAANRFLSWWHRHSCLCRDRLHRQECLCHQKAGWLFLAILSACTLGCEQKMAEQPSYAPLGASKFFPNGQAARPLPDGAIARQWQTNDKIPGSGLKPGTGATPKAKGTPEPPPPDAPSSPDRFATEVPFELTRGDIERGRERFAIFCSVCHDRAGTGHGKVVERGYIKPPNYHTDNSRGFARYSKQIPLREVPIGYIVEVIRRGYGAMPRYGPQIDARDRWRIAAYVRALQLSQHADVKALPPGAKSKTEKALGVPK